MELPTRHNSTHCSCHLPHLSGWIKNTEKGWNILSWLHNEWLQLSFGTALILLARLCPEFLSWYESTYLQHPSSQSSPWGSRETIPGTLAPGHLLLDSQQPDQVPSVIFSTKGVEWRPSWKDINPKHQPPARDHDTPWESLDLNSWRGQLENKEVRWGNPTNRLLGLTYKAKDSLTRDPMWSTECIKTLKR